jgi:hypothetical protein
MERRQFLLGGTAILTASLISCESHQSTSSTGPTVQPKPGFSSQPKFVPSGKTWEIQSVDSMKETKDRIRNPRSNDFIERWMDAAKELGANYVAIDTPMENPTNGNSFEYTNNWLIRARQRDLNIFHRHPSLSFEGIYDVKKDPTKDYSDVAANYIKQNPNFFRSGDLFSLPEPQNGGISGLNCNQDCIFQSRSEFNEFLQNFVKKCQAAFSEIGLKDQVQVGFFGFDGFVTAGLDNPDWLGKTALDSQTMAAMNNNLAVDHYPKKAENMTADIKTIKSAWPNAKLFFSEIGAGNGESPEQMRTIFSAIRDSDALGINYWHLGMGGQEALINEDFSKRPNFYEVQAWFKGQR